MPLWYILCPCFQQMQLYFLLIPTSLDTCHDFVTVSYYLWVLGGNILFALLSLRKCKWIR